VSSEPCATRPNPFGDSGIARKRRRTSLSGSRSLSVDSAQSDQDPDSSVTLDDHDPTDHGADVTMDASNPATPQTPDGQQDQTDSGPNPVATAERPSSRVTINIRQANPASPTSPTPLPDTDEPGSDDVRLSVEVADGEADLSHTADEALAESHGTPGSSSSYADSPDIEVIDARPDDDGLDEEEPEVTIISEGRSPPLDPTPEFPYHENETMVETVNRLTNYVSTRTSSPLAPSLSKSLDFSPICD
jgi:ubiquitin carboxyl-terminal hydrolase 34